MSGVPTPPQDPKLKLPAVASTPARAAADGAELAALRKRVVAAEEAVAALTARVAALEATPKSNARSNKSNSLTPDAGGFDKKAYQRDLMRKRRAKAKA